MALFRKKPVVIEAFQWRESTMGAAPEWLIEAERVYGRARPGEVRQVGEGLEIYTLEGTMTANPGDWIIRGVAGELYPCKPDIFAATYDPVSAPPVRDGEG